jgi:hypothetical protein
MQRHNQLEIQVNLRQLLTKAGIRNDIIKAVEKKKLTAEQELEVQEKAMAMTKVMLNEALRYRKSQEPPVPKKKTIIVNE